MGLMDKVKSQASLLAEKAQEGAKVGQERLMQMQTKRQSDALLLELGGLTYLARAGRPTPGADARIDELLDRRVPLLEQLDPVARAARLREPFSEQLQSNRAAVVRLMRDQCEGSFAPELETSPEPLLTAITTSCSWSTWYHLRNDQQLSSAEATDVVRLMLRSVLRGGVGIDVRPEAAVGST